MARVLLLGRGHAFGDLGPIAWTELRERGHDPELRTDWAALEPDHLDRAGIEVVVDFSTSRQEWTNEQRETLLERVRSGEIGYVGVHAATYMPLEDHPELGEFREMIGGRLTGHPGVLQSTTEIVDDEHPITTGIEDFTYEEEPYELDYDADAVDVLAVTHHESFGEMPVIWTKSYGEGNVVYYAAGHNEAAFDRPEFHEIIGRSVEWVLAE
jgi:type 1 glutamine amidotransferase